MTSCAVTVSPPSSFGCVRRLKSAVWAVSFVTQQRKRPDKDMPTWRDEFIRLSELHQHEVKRWLEGTRNANLVIDVGESQKAFLLRWLSAGEPSRNQQMPD